ncbi:chemotaxis protein [uncultured Pseudoteredinibacter sp.]|uniref:chemotaxis protein n=1 Tax=uncultured Pseudoteredinibacter sp. TaxID=1641701 RepID=UPI002618F535|nr:chemotaxis protein [uncultured Pseudoteredinibacter sp.]
MTRSNAAYKEAISAVGNTIEVLLFKLTGDQLYGINVFKVKEVLPCPALSSIPNSDESVPGCAHIRGQTIPVIDLAKAAGMGEITDYDDRFLIVTEYSRSIQGFLVYSVDRIVTLQWSDLSKAPAGVGEDNYLTAVAKIDEKLVEIMDVEKVLDEVNPVDEEIEEDVVPDEVMHEAHERKLLIIDDSAVARKQIKRVADKMNIDSVQAINGQDALDYLNKQSAEGHNLNSEIYAVVCDIEMPGMDGYTFATRAKGDERYSEIPILLHSSLGGVLNEELVKKSGANQFLAKFEPNELAKWISTQVIARGGVIEEA